MLSNMRRLGFKLNATLVESILAEDTPEAVTFSPQRMNLGDRH